MARLTRVFGVILVVLGAVYFVLTGSAHPTAAIFGLLLLLCGVLASTPDAGRRMLWMHLAVTVGLIGLIFPAVRGGRALAHSVTLTAVQRTAAQEEVIMAVICAVFTAVCVRSFILARIARTA